MIVEIWTMSPIGTVKRREGRVEVGKVRRQSEIHLEGSCRQQKGHQLPQRRVEDLVIADSNSMVSAWEALHLVITGVLGSDDTTKMDADYRTSLYMQFKTPSHVI
jgi:hypothetical protein